MTRRNTFRAMVLAGLVLTSGTVGAQSSEISATPVTSMVESRIAPTTSVNATSLAGPRARPVGLLRNAVVDSTAPLPAPRDPGENVGQNLAMIGVGAAGLAAGLLIGGDGGNAIAIVGSVVGLWGLYRYMR